MPTVIIAAPISNKPTYVSGAAGRTLRKTIKHDYPKTKVVFIPDEECINDHAAIIQKHAKKDKGVLFSFYGHGKAAKICGQIPPGCGKSKPGMVDSDNVSILKNTITHATACWTGAELGRMAENIGVEAYVGSRAPVYVAFSMSEHNYKNDVIDVWNTFPLSLLDGNTVADGIGAMLDKSREYEANYNLKKEEWLYADYYSNRFKRNRNILVPFGNLAATLV